LRPFNDIFFFLIGFAHLGGRTASRKPFPPKSNRDPELYHQCVGNTQFEAKQPPEQ
jgi:hypothetical protein